MAAATANNRLKSQVLTPFQCVAAGRHLNVSFNRRASPPPTVRRALVTNMDWLTLPIGNHAPKIVNAIVEVPYGGTNKYEYDPTLKIFRLDRPLYASVHYPGEYGFIPGTLSADGDALDILILVTHATFTGCVLEARPVGVLEMADQGVADQKILAVAKSSAVHAEICSHKDVPPHSLREVEYFFSIYKELEGKHADVKGWRDKEEAHRLITQGQQRFQRKHPERVGGKWNR
jgi:inorganic pyrophosphatase